MKSNNINNVILVFIAIFLFVLGSLFYAVVIPKEKVEIIKEVPVLYDTKVHKWVDSENQIIVYLWSDDYNGTIVPMYTTVPPMWYSELLRLLVELNGGSISDNILEQMPKDWLDSVIPGSSNNIDNYRGLMGKVPIK